MKGSWNTYRSFDVLLTVHLSIFILVFKPTSCTNFCFTISLFHASTCFEHHVLIVRRSKLYYTASGIITLCRWPSHARATTTDPVHKQLLNHSATYGTLKNISLTFLHLPLFDLTLGTEQKVFLDYWLLFAAQSDLDTLTCFSPTSQRRSDGRRIIETEERGVS